MPGARLARREQLQGQQHEQHVGRADHQHPRRSAGRRRAARPDRRPGSADRPGRRTDRDGIGVLGAGPVDRHLATRHRPQPDGQQRRDDQRPRPPTSEHHRRREPATRIDRRDQRARAARPPPRRCPAAALAAVSSSGVRDRLGRRALWVGRLTTRLVAVAGGQQVDQRRPARRPSSRRRWRASRSPGRAYPPARTRWRGNRSPSDAAGRRQQRGRDELDQGDQPDRRRPGGLVGIQQDRDPRPELGAGERELGEEDAAQILVAKRPPRDADRPGHAEIRPRRQGACARVYGRARRPIHPAALELDDARAPRPMSRSGVLDRGDRLVDGSLMVSAAPFDRLGTRDPRGLRASQVVLPASLAVAGASSSASDTLRGRVGLRARVRPRRDPGRSVGLADRRLDLLHRQTLAPSRSSRICSIRTRVFLRGLLHLGPNGRPAQHGDQADAARDQQRRDDRPARIGPRRARMAAPPCLARSTRGSPPRRGRCRACRPSVGELGSSTRSTSRGRPGCSDRARTISSRRRFRATVLPQPALLDWRLGISALRW